MMNVVGARIGSTVTNSLDAIKKAVDKGINIEPLSREHMELMSACDLGARWDSMAKSPVLFLLDDDGKVYPADYKPNKEGE